MLERENTQRMEKGFIKLYRNITEWCWYDDIPTCRLFNHLLIKANWEDKKWHDLVIKRGQLITSQAHLAKETKLTRQQVRRALDNLNSTNEITKQTTSKYTIITINNYDKYQGYNQVENQQTTNKQPTNNQQTTTTKEYKELKEVKEEYIEIDGHTYRANDPNRPLTYEERKEYGLL